jgi:predicted SnoaL-like aldol condensation-catalyzing enzyme
MDQREERNRAVTRRLLEDLWSGGDLSIADELFSDALVHHMAPPGIPSGPEGQRMFLATMRERMPGMRTTVHDLLVDGDLVAVRWSRTAAGPDGTPVTYEGADILRIIDGTIVEIWAYQPQQ